MTTRWRWCAVAICAAFFSFSWCEAGEQTPAAGQKSFYPGWRVGRAKDGRILRLVMSIEEDHGSHFQEEKSHVC